VSLALRQELIATARAMNASGINQGKSGNLSVRDGAGCLITPSALAYEALQPDDIVALDERGEPSGRRVPSSEWSMHWAILKARSEAGAVVHAHPTYATALACHGRGIPAFHYMVAVAGGRDVRCAEYATFGSEQLASSALRALEGRSACLLAHHGLVAFGPELGSALALAIEVETLARQYWHALQLGAPPLLDDAEMERVLEKFRSYGR
jgi:L-fuculose-phosphate aldolase